MWSGPWKRFVVLMSFGGVCITLVGARDLSVALHDGVPVRPAVETVVAGLVFLGVLVAAARLKGRRARPRRRQDPLASDTGRPSERAGDTPYCATPNQPGKRDRYDDLIDDELSKM